MPLERKEVSDEFIWGFWKITETEHDLATALNRVENCPSDITNELKRKEFLGARVLLSELMKLWHFRYRGIFKNEFGKPFLNDYPLEISLSHSYPYVAAVIHRTKAVGIDLEQPKTKLLRVAPRVFSENEIITAGNDLIKHCIIWCAKETLVKIHGKKDLNFSQEIVTDPFERGENGHLTGRIVVNKVEEIVPLQYHVYDNFVVVLNR